VAGGKKIEAEMTLKVVYAGQDARKRRTLRESEKDVVILLFDRWDDYDYKTTFPTECRIGGEAVELGSIQILFDNEMTSFAYLDSLVEQGWDGVFPVAEKTYISAPAALSFYEQIEDRTQVTMISGWSRTKTRRSGDAYPDFQSAIQTHRL
jgi:hypothetical protein